MIITRIYRKIRSEGFWPVFKRRASYYFYNLRFWLNSLAINKNDSVQAHKVFWKYGYYELPDITKPTGYNSGLGGDPHQLYLEIIKPYINAQTRVLEVGAGGGAYTRGLLPAKEVWILEAQPRWMTRIDQRLGHPKNLKFIQVKDFSCSGAPDNYFDYLFSVGTFPYFTQAEQEEYFKNLYPKMKTGANCFVMVADFEKYKKYLGYYTQDQNSPVSWKYNTADMTCALLRKIGWKIISPDIDLYKRDAIVHFVR